MERDRRIRLVLVSIFCIFTILIYAPLEMYLTNINEFWFDLSQFWFVVVLIGGIGLFILISLVLTIFTSFKYGYVLYGLDAFIRIIVLLNSERNSQEVV